MTNRIIEEKPVTTYWGESGYPVMSSGVEAPLDSERLIELLQDERSPRALIELIRTARIEIARSAAACLGAMGRMSESEDLAKILLSEDVVRVEITEDTLWSIWFRQAGVRAAEELQEAAELAATGLADESIRRFDQLIALHPMFAEAYHQRGMVRHLCESYCEAMRDFLRTVELNRVHFAAMGNLGHCCVELGRHEEARRWYLTALKVHPRMPGIRQVLRRLRDTMGVSPHITT